MSFYIHRMGIIFSSLALIILSVAQAFAEDIEIYMVNNQGTSSVQPNILFILDTSGSMGDHVTSNVLPSDPLSDTDYSTLSGCSLFDANKMYVMPANKTIDDIACATQFSNSYINLNLNKCDGLTTIFDESGVYSDIFTQWAGAPKDTWDNYRSNQNDASVNYMECRGDRGKHGDGGAGVYININNDGVKYSTSSDNETWAGSMSDEFTFYSGNYLNYQIYAQTTTVSVAKIDIMKSVIKTVMDGVSGVDIGLMKFNINKSPQPDDYDDPDWTWDKCDQPGGVIKHPVLDVALTRNDMFATMGNWNAEDCTPLSESMYEAYRYFAGMKPWFAGRPSGESGLPGEEAVEGTTVATVDSEKYYKTPVDPNATDCEKQFIILLSDGAPVRDTSADEKISALTGTTCSGSGECLDDLTGFMYNKGFDAFIAATGETVQGVTVQTYTVGFDYQGEILEAAAIAGGGEYKEADSANGLLQTLLELINSIKSVNTTFSSPAVSVNAFNRTSHRSELYFTVFNPSLGAHWDGNFKRYKLHFKDDGTPEILDRNNDPAVNLATGFFDKDATSYWTTGGADGSDAKLGGAASVLTNTRKVYTNIAGSNLTTAGNAVNDGNATLDLAVLGIPAQDAAYRTKLLDWASGLKENGDARLVMGDPLHSQPALIQYGGTEDAAEIIAYVATNDGYLHSINTNDGTENFSFVPKELLANLDAYYRDAGGESKLYGLDGSIVAWVNDVNRDGIINTSTDHVYIYFGMRRGGSNYYAMDVTLKDAPKMLWTINGGSGDFSELGQTWSRPVLRKIRKDGVIKQVLVFAGGYDTNQDSPTLRNTGDSIGRAVYMVDAVSGALLWQASANAAADTTITEMQYSMPADLAAIDSNADGLLDVIYAVDMGGQVFRFDFPESELNKVVGGRIALLAADTLADSRRFYYSPDVAIIKNKDRTPSLAVVLSSGYRSHPNDIGTQDRIYMIRDKFPVSGVTPTYSTLTSTDLYDATDNLIGNDGTEDQQTEASAELYNKQGWYIDLENTGEKGLSKPFIFDNKVFVTTFLPYQGEITSACTPNEGGGLLYIMDLYDAQPEYDFAPLVDDMKPDRAKTLKKAGIPADPVLIKIAAMQDVTCVGTECFGIGGNNQLKSEYWFEQ